MAVGVGTSDCSEFSSMVDYDPWVVPHQLLPAAAVLTGINWREVIIIMYMWETLEVIFLNCLQIATQEHTPNALISDPFQCFAGIFVTIILFNVTGSGPLIPARVGAYFWSSLFILPGIPLIVGGNYVWIYIPLWFGLLFILNHHYKMNRGMFLYFILYSLFVSVPILALKDYFNSFYMGLLSALTIVVLSVVIKNKT